MHAEREVQTFAALKWWINTGPPNAWWKCSIVYPFDWPHGESLIWNEQCSAFKNNSRETEAIFEVEKGNGSLGSRKVIVKTKLCLQGWSLSSRVILDKSPLMLLDMYMKLWFSLFRQTRSWLFPFFFVYILHFFLFWKQGNNLPILEAEICSECIWLYASWYFYLRIPNRPVLIKGLTDTGKKC